MNKINNNNQTPNEISLEELAKVTGGSGANPTDQFDKYVWCCITQYNGSYTAASLNARRFCSMICMHNGTNDCVQWKHNPSITDESLKSKFERYYGYPFIG